MDPWVDHVGVSRRAGYFSVIISPKLVDNLRVAAIKWSSRPTALGWDSSLDSECESLGSFAFSTRRWGLCAVQIIRKWCTDSGFSWHAGQVGDSAAPMRARCKFRGIWPVRSCISRLACLRVNSAVSFLNRGDGTDPSMALSLGYRFDFARCVAASCLAVSLMVRLIADVLVGSGLRSMVGSVCAGCFETR